MEGRAEKNDIDEVMEEMEAQTSKPTDKIRAVEELTAEIPAEAAEQVPDDKDSIQFAAPKPSSRTMPLSISRPGLIYPSVDTDQIYYDFNHENIGMALIFNQVNFKGHDKRKESDKDASDLGKVLSDMGFDVHIYRDLPKKKIMDTLGEVSQIDHSNNDCLLVAILTHGEHNGKINAFDGNFMVQELWRYFVGSNCKSLIGKPKLFFVQACRGTMVDPGTLLKPTPKTRNISMADTVDAQTLPDEVFVLPTLADLLVMYSTSEGYYSFRNPNKGSWFIQALCAEFIENPHEDLMRILTAVNRRVAYTYQSNVPHNAKVDAAKQMPNIQSMLTKTFYFKKKNVNFQVDKV